MLVSAVGDPMSLTISLVLLYAVNGAPGVGLAYACRVLGALTTSGFFGTLTDRADRRRLIVTLEGFRFVLLLAMPFLTHLSVGVIYPALVLLGGAESLVAPARQAAIPEIVGASRIETGNAGLLTAFSLAQAGGFALSGFLLTLLPDPRVLYWGDAASFAASGLLILSLGPLGGGSAVRRLGGVVAAFQLKGATALLLIATGGSTMIGVGVSALLPVSYRLSSRGPVAFTAMEAALIGGLVVGSLVAGRLRAERSHPAMTAALAVFAAGGAAIAIAPSLGLGLAAAAVSGLGNAVYSVANLSSLQRLAGTALRGTVMAARFTMTQTANAIGLAAGGGLAAAFGPRWAFVVMGAGLAVLAAVSGAWGLLSPAAQTEGQPLEAGGPSRPPGP